MIKGMTGYGSVELSNGKVKGVVEIKSVNHRYLDINYYLPQGFSSLEEKIRNILSKDLRRGKVIVSIKFIQKPFHKYLINKDAVKQYLTHAKQLKRSFGLENNLSVSDLVKLPGVVEVQETFLKSNDLWPAIQTSVRKSLKSLVDMRKREGKSLALDISGLLKRMLAHIKNIQVKSRKNLMLQKKKLTGEEFSSFQKSTDINEELSRLAHHVQEMKALLKTDVSVGKKIDFIAQEMQRETNTIGSKQQDKTISNAVIALKSKIEKIREQAQNIE